MSTEIDNSLELEKYLQTHGLTRAEFAAQIPCSEAYISMIARGKASPGWKMAKRIQAVTMGMVKTSIWFKTDEDQVIGEQSQDDNK